MKLNIRVSEIPSIIGVNPYSDIKPIILRFWQKANPKDYSKYILSLVEKQVIENPLIKNEDIIKHHIEKYNIDIETDLKSCKTSGTTYELKEKKNNIIKKIEDNKNILPNDKKIIKDTIKNITQTGYGNHHENYAIEIYSNIYKQKVLDQQKYIKKIIAQSDIIDWYITGKIDGIREDGILVEVKNRVNKLFLTLRPYENIQVQTYLHLFKFKTGHLVEFIKLNNEQQINVIEVEYKSDEWKTIKHKLQSFIEFFHLFLESDQLKYFMLTETNKNINEYYKKLLFSKSYI
jgi:hypothetical protein